MEPSVRIRPEPCIPLLKSFHHHLKPLMVGWLLVEAATGPTPPVASGTNSPTEGVYRHRRLMWEVELSNKVLPISFQAVRDKPICLTEILYIGISV